MDSLFGVSLTSIMISLLVLMAAAFAVIGWIAWRNPLLVRMGLRNVARRKAQTTLIAVGLMLSTLIVSAAFATGDTVGYSITNEIYAQLEEVDFVIAPDTETLAGPAGEKTLSDDFLSSLRAELAGDEAFDGIAGLVVETLPVVNLPQRLSEPEGNVVGVDPATVDSFRALRALDGRPIPAATLDGNSTYITERLADALAAGPGDTVTVFFDNEGHEFEVLDVVRDTAVTGAAGDPTTGGMVVHIESLRALTGTPGSSYIAVSSRGGTRGSLALDDPTVEDRIEAFIDSHPEANATILFTKEEAVAIGELIGSVFVTFFLVAGLFSITAGIMLIFLIFVMLAAERRPEMGMARAVGMNRLHLTESFLAEGMAYNVGSAAIGAVLGLGVAGLLIFVLVRIAADFGLSISFHFNPQAFVIAYSLGVVLTFATVIFSAYRAANLNIVRAIRDLPEPQPLRGEDRSIVGLLMSAAGALWYLVWLLIITIFIGVGVALFIFTLGTYGIGLLPAGLLAAWFVFGARRAARQSLPRGRGFPVHPLDGLRFLLEAAIVGWRRVRHLLRADRKLRAVGNLLLYVLYVLWWVAFNVVALITWLLLRTKSWADRRRNAGGWALWMIVLGLVLIYFGGWQTSFLFAYTGGTTLAVLAIAMLAVYFGAGARPAFTVAGLALVWYWLLPLPFSLLFEGGEDFHDPIDGVLRFVGLDPDPGDGNVEMFFVSGISITAAATLVVIFNADAILGLVRALGGLLGGIAPALKTAVAYPLAAKFRTAMTLAMFGLVVFSLVISAFLNFNFKQLFLGEEASAGFDVVVDANPSNRIPDLRAALTEEGYDVDAVIAGVGTLVSAPATLREREASGDFNRYPLQGVDEEFLRLARLPLLTRAAGYESDEAVIEALRTDPTVAVIDPSRFSRSHFGEEERFELSVGRSDLEDGQWTPIPLLVRNTDTDETVELKIIAVIEPQLTSVLSQFLAVFVNRSVVDRSFDGGEHEHFFLTTVDGSKEGADAVAKGVESTLLERGVQAESIEGIIDDEAGQSAAFQLLFEGFMSLGLIVGIAALGVIAFRTVVERRQQIGMLRAIGYTRRLIALSFFFESSFIALTGILMGLVLGAALSYNLLTSPEFTDGAEIDFRVPWVRLAIIGGVAYGASVLMTLIPARSASRVPIAAALRYE